MDEENFMTKRNGWQDAQSHPKCESLRTRSERIAAFVENLSK